MSPRAVLKYQLRHRYDLKFRDGNLRYEQELDVKALLSPPSARIVGADTDVRPLEAGTKVERSMDGGKTWELLFTVQRATATSFPHGSLKFVHKYDSVKSAAAAHEVSARAIRRAVKHEKPIRDASLADDVYFCFGDSGGDNSDNSSDGSSGKSSGADDGNDNDDSALDNTDVVAHASLTSVHSMDLTGSTADGNSDVGFSRMPSAKDILSEGPPTVDVPGVDLSGLGNNINTLELPDIGDNINTLELPDILVDGAAQGVDHAQIMLRDVPGDKEPGGCCDDCHCGCSSDDTAPREDEGDEKRGGCCRGGGCCDDDDDDGCCDCDCSD